MYPTVTFRFTSVDIDSVDQEVILDLLRSFVDNGIITEYFSYPIICNQIIEYQATTIDLNSLDVKHYNENTNRLIQLLKNEDNIEFNYTVLSTSKADPSFEPSIDTVDSFILYYGGNSPVRSLNNFNEVPLYLLPPTSEHKTNYSNINSWKRNYEAIYHLWFRGEIDEDYFYSQLSNFDSSLTKQGMKISRLISSLTSKECYYYLYRYPGEEENVINKVCPSCSESWRLEDKLFDLFEFKCQKCKIIS